MVKNRATNRDADRDLHSRSCSLAGGIIEQILTAQNASALKDIHEGSRVRPHDRCTQAIGFKFGLFYALGYMFNLGDARTD